MTILAGYSTTPEGHRALEVALDEARLRGVPLHVVRFLGHELGESPTGVRHDLQAAEAAEAELEALRQRLTAEGVDVSVELRHGPHGGAARSLLDAAKELGAELIVIGVRQRSPVGKLVLGSVSQEVLLGADAPVLAVKAAHPGR